MKRAPITVSEVVKRFMHQKGRVTSLHLVALVAALPASKQRPAMCAKRSRTTFSVLTVALLALSTCTAFAKGEGVGYWLEGKVTGVHINGNKVDLVIAGTLTLDQYSAGPETRQAIRYECARGFSATLGQWKPFFAMTSNWRGGGIRGEGELGRLAQAALEQGSVIKIELQNPQIDFTHWQCPIVKADAIRATDHALR
jgi:hypothetical protein